MLYEHRQRKFIAMKNQTLSSFTIQQRKTSPKLPVNEKQNK
jgi:hypothetical protein